MKLRDYLDMRAITQAEFAGRIGISNAEISRILAGLRHPNPNTMRAIMRETDGAVTPNDFFGLSASDTSETAI